MRRIHVLTAGVVEVWVGVGEKEVCRREWS